MFTDVAIAEPQTRWATCSDPSSLACKGFRSVRKPSHTPVKAEDVTAQQEVNVYMHKVTFELIV